MHPPDQMRGTKNYVQPVSPVLISNMTLLAVACLLLFFYVVQANVIAANKYDLKVLNEKLTSLNEARTILEAGISQIEEPSKLVEYALSRNMVEAKNVIYLFENGDVALKP